MRGCWVMLFHERYIHSGLRGWLGLMLSAGRYIPANAKDGLGDVFCRAISSLAECEGWLGLMLLYRARLPSECEGWLGLFFSAGDILAEMRRLDWVMHFCRRSILVEAEIKMVQFILYHYRSIKINR